MFSHNLFDDPFYQMEQMKRRMLQDFERSLNQSFGGYSGSGGYGGYGGYGGSGGYGGYGLGSRDPFSRPSLRYEPEILSLRHPEVLSLRIPERMPVDENTTFFAKYEVNDNGHVWKKTIEKKPGEDWKTNVEEYDQKPSIKEGQSTQQEKPKEMQQGEVPQPLESKGTESRGMESSGLESRSLESRGRETRGAPVEDKVDIEDIKTPSQETASRA